MKTKTRDYSFYFVILALMVACGDFNDDSRDDDGFAIPLPVEEIKLSATIDYEPMERESGDYELGFNATLAMPLQIDVLRGNSGVGYAAITVGDTRFCYRGNALSENDGTGNAYVFVYTKERLAICSIVEGGETVFDERIQVEAGDVVEFVIEAPGCSFEANTCVFTEAQAVIEVEESEL